MDARRGVDRTLGAPEDGARASVALEGNWEQTPASAAETQPDARDFAPGSLLKCGTHAYKCTVPVWYRVQQNYE